MADIQKKIGDLLFEWDEDKATANIRKHGISFETAGRVFQDDSLIEIFDSLHSDDECIMSSLDEMKRNEELDDCPEISDEQVKIMSLVLSRPGVRGNSRASFYYQGMEEARVSAIRNLMGGMSMTLRQAMEALKIPSDEYDKYAAVI